MESKYYRDNLADILEFTEGGTCCPWRTSGGSPASRNTAL